MLRDRRKALGILHKELAKRIGSDRSYISRLEKGETNLQTSSLIPVSRTKRAEFFIDKEIM